MDNTFILFLIIFGVLIVYLFQQKQELVVIEQNQMTNNLIDYVQENDFQEGFENPEENNIINNTNQLETNIENNIETNIENNIEKNISQEVVPSNAPDTPVSNGYSTSLIYNHPYNIGNCYVSNLAPMDYYKDVNNQLNSQLEQPNDEKVMNGGMFGNIMGDDKYKIDYYPLVMEE